MFFQKSGRWKRKGDFPCDIQGFWNKRAVWYIGIQTIHKGKLVHVVKYSMFFVGFQSTGTGNDNRMWCIWKLSICNVWSIDSRTVTCITLFSFDFMETKHGSKLPFLDTCPIEHVFRHLSHQTGWHKNYLPRWVFC